MSRYHFILLIPPYKTYTQLKIKSFSKVNRKFEPLKKFVQKRKPRDIAESCAFWSRSSLQGSFKKGQMVSSMAYSGWQKYWILSRCCRLDDCIVQHFWLHRENAITCANVRLWSDVVGEYIRPYIPAFLATKHKAITCANTGAIPRIQMLQQVNALYSNILWVTKVRESSWCYFHASCKSDGKSAVQNVSI